MFLLGVFAGIDLLCTFLQGHGLGLSSNINSSASMSLPLHPPTPTAPPHSARGGFICTAASPLDNGGPGLLTMAPTSKPTYYTVALWDRFMETETRGFWPHSSFLNVEEGWERSGGGRWIGGGAQVSEREDRRQGLECV